MNESYNKMTNVRNLCKYIIIFTCDIASNHANLLQNEAQVFHEHNIEHNIAIHQI